MFFPFAISFRCMSKLCAAKYRFRNSSLWLNSLIIPDGIYNCFKSQCASPKLPHVIHVYTWWYLTPTCGFNRIWASKDWTNQAVAIYVASYLQERGWWICEQRSFEWWLPMAKGGIWGMLVCVKSEPEDREPEHYIVAIIHGICVLDVLVRLKYQ